MSVRSATHHCLAIDLRGHGNEPPSSETKFDAPGIEPFLADLYREFHVDATPRAMRSTPTSGTSTARSRAGSSSTWSAGIRRTRAVLHTIGQPVLAIQSTLIDTELHRVPVRTGELTRFSGALLDCVPGAHIETVACGHFKMLEAQNKTNALTAGFVNGLRG